MKQTMYRVVVMYGTRPNSTFARVPSLDDAEKLKALAISQGYDCKAHPVRIETELVDEESESQAAGTNEAGHFVPHRPPGKPRKVHDLRPRAEKTPPRQTQGVQHALSA